ncbi:MAG: SGNH/GDSL hydrolase family protein [Oscillospiraceae bacterium]|nr:SGNH/GDSL hydrolase family protein [Oscillospiraceae bacterium]
MKHIIAAAVSMLLLFAFFVDTAIAGQNVSSLFVAGDSISTGYNLENYFSKGREFTYNYANRLKTEYSCPLVNRAIDGQKASQLSDDFLNGEYDNDISGCGVFIMSIGANDYLGALQVFLSASGSSIDFSRLADREYLNSLAEVFASPLLAAAFSGLDESVYDNIINIISRIKNINPDALVIVHTIYNPFDGIDGMDLLAQLMNGYLDLVNGRIRDGAQENGYTYIDVCAAFAGKASQYIIRGDIHPTLSGHELIASLCKEKIDDYCSESVDSSNDAGNIPPAQTQTTDIETEENTADDYVTQTDMGDINDPGADQDEIKDNKITKIFISICAVIALAAVASAVILHKKGKKR